MNIYLMPRTVQHIIVGVTGFSTAVSQWLEIYLFFFVENIDVTLVFPARTITCNAATIFSRQELR